MEKQNESTSLRSSISTRNEGVIMGKANVMFSVLLFILFCFAFPVLQGDEGMV